MAHAFPIRVQDPPTRGAPAYPNVPFSITFGACQFGEGGQGCYYGQNLGKTVLRSLDIDFVNTPGLNSQSVECQTNEPNSLFATSSCQLVAGTTYVLDFSGGMGIQPKVVFTLVEFGVDPSAFQGGAVGFPTTQTFTPEPSSLVLLATGFTLVGCTLLRRKQAVLAERI